VGLPLSTKTDNFRRREFAAKNAEAEVVRIHKVVSFEKRHQPPFRSIPLRRAHLRNCQNSQCSHYLRFEKSSSVDSFSNLAEKHYQAVDK
jgi:hypothetical protein